jgi:hypothetical protein
MNRMNKGSFGRAIAQAVSRRLPMAAAQARGQAGYAGFVVDKVTLQQVFSEYFSLHRLLHTHRHLSSGAGTIGQLMEDVPSGLSLTPPHPTSRNLKGNLNGRDYYSR